MSAAAKSVAESTQKLVEAAKSATQLQEEEENKPDWDNSSETLKRAAEMTTQVNILKLQKELEKERERLADIRKQEYKESQSNLSGLGRGLPPGPGGPPSRGGPIGPMRGGPIGPMRGGLSRGAPPPGGKKKTFLKYF